MSIRETIRTDLIASMKSGDTVRRDALRYLDSQIKNEEISLKKRESGLDDTETIAVIRRSLKQRKDSIEKYESGGRSDLAEKEKKEAEILSQYLPVQLGDDEIRKTVREIVSRESGSQFGAIMKTVMLELRGKADGSSVKRIVDEEIQRKN